jgi:FkbM family methyltransferase
MAFWDGLQVRAYPDDPIITLVAGTRLPDYDDMLFLLRYLRQDDVFVDVGAEIGLYTLLGALSVPRGRVIAFEPNPVAARRLSENLALNHLKNVAVRSVAAGSKEGWTLLTSNLGLGNHIIEDESVGLGIKVPITTLDRELSDYPNIALVKVDVEGFESRVLEGATSLFQRHRAPVWIVEFNDLGRRYGAGNAAISDFFSRHGYSMYKYDASTELLRHARGNGGHGGFNLIFIRELADTLSRLEESGFRRRGT